jgi:predicted flap endonuclease-1-like 5' DNA nuclease
MLQTIEGIGPAVADRLRSAGVRSVEQLLKAGGLKNGRAELAGKTGLSEARILKLVNCADLMRIRGVGGEYAELLEAAGVDSVPELAQRNAATLREKMASVNAARRLVRVLPSQSRVENWVVQANRLDRAVHH